MRLGRVISASTLTATNPIPDTDLYPDLALNWLDSDDSVGLG